MTFRGDAVLVTGAAKGIGRAFALTHAAARVGVAAVDVDEEGLRELCSLSPWIRAWICDVRDPEAVGAVVRDVEEQVGAVDRVVNSAGVAPVASLLSSTSEEVRRVMEINYLGTVNVCRAVLPRMTSRGRGEVVNLASIAGWIPTKGLGAYSASKFAVVAFSEVLAAEARGAGVKVCCVCPSLVHTPMGASVAEGLTGRTQVIGMVDALDVVDETEDALERGELFVFPGWVPKLAVRLRRAWPRLASEVVDRAVGTSL
ncbi:MAG: short-chain dehydrogenase [Acidimicrobiales bacterium]|nr:MAG: short-chain dehydrogenase [Acidimicrobiales bacterium]